MVEPDELTELIAHHLEVDSQYVEHVEACNQDRIAQVRSAGRKAGRLLGYKILTHQTDPAKRADNKVVVIVAVTDGPSEDDKQRLEDRALLLLDNYRRQHSAGD